MDESIVVFVCFFFSFPFFIYAKVNLSFLKLRNEEEKLIVIYLHQVKIVWSVALSVPSVVAVVLMIKVNGNGGNIRWNNSVDKIVKLFVPHITSKDSFLFAIATVSFSCSC